MNQFSRHNSELKAIIEQYASNNSNDIELVDLVDLDSIDEVLRAELSIEEMREAGSFFTGQSLSYTLIQNLENVSDDSKIIDPTCGAGNLLIAASRNLEISPTLSQTMQRWGEVLYGYDIHHSFIESAKLRIIIDALSRGCILDYSIEEALSDLKNIKVKDFFNVQASDLSEITHAVINPPFTTMRAPRNQLWNGGNITTSALIFYDLLNKLPTHCHFSAILPDVLRSGSRYQKLRQIISKKSRSYCQLWGEFNKKTQIDVFVISGVLKDSNAATDWLDSHDYNYSIRDFYDVHVGSVVPHRDSFTGQSHPYLHGRNSPAWEEISDSNENILYSGKLFTPPFVIIKRTSSPKSKKRLIPSLVTINQPCAIENHLIVILPKSKKLSDCIKLLENIKSDEVNKFINHRIRLRHLTVKSIKDIPIVNSKYLPMS